MQATFKTRDFTAALETNFVWKVESFDWSIEGGPKSAELTAEMNDDSWDAATLLRCPVEIIDDDSDAVWWGYVASVQIPTKGDIQVGTSLDQMYNSVKVSYAYLPAGESNARQQLTTTFSTATDSENIYGTKEYIHNIGDGTSASAEAMRARILERYRYPKPTITPYKGDKIILKLRGWWDTLDWTHYNNSGTAEVATTTQISAIVTAEAQFLNGTHIFNASGVNTNEFRDGQESALTYIEDLLSTGTSAGLELMAIVNRNRYLEIKTITEPSIANFRLRDDKMLEEFAETVVPASKLYYVIGKYVSLKSVPTAIADYSIILPFTIGEASWRKGEAIYRPLGQDDVLKVNFSGAF